MKYTSRFSRLVDKIKSQFGPVERRIYNEIIEESLTHRTSSSCGEEVHHPPVIINKDDSIPSVGQGMPEVEPKEEEFEIVGEEDHMGRDETSSYYFVGNLDQGPTREGSKGSDHTHTIMFDLVAKDERGHQLTVKAGEVVTLLPCCYDDTAQGQVWHLVENASGQVGYVPIEYIYPPVQRKDKGLTPSPSLSPKTQSFKPSPRTTPGLDPKLTKSRPDFYWHPPPSYLPPKVYQVRHLKKGLIGYTPATSPSSTKFAYLQENALRVDTVDTGSLERVSPTRYGSLSQRAPSQTMGQYRSSSRSDSSPDKLEVFSGRSDHSSYRMTAPSDYIVPIRQDSPTQYYPSTGSNRRISLIDAPRLRGMSLEGNRSMTSAFSHHSLPSTGSLSSGEEDCIPPRQLELSREDGQGLDGGPSEVIPSHFGSAKEHVEGSCRRPQSVTPPGHSINTNPSPLPLTSDQRAILSRKQRIAAVHREITGDICIPGTPTLSSGRMSSTMSTTPTLTGNFLL